MALLHAKSIPCYPSSLLPRLAHNNPASEAPSPRDYYSHLGLYLRETLGERASFTPHASEGSFLHVMCRASKWEKFTALTLVSSTFPTNGPSQVLAPKTRQSDTYSRYRAELTEFCRILRNLQILYSLLILSIRKLWAPLFVQKSKYLIIVGAWTSGFSP